MRPWRSTVWNKLQKTNDYIPRRQQKSATFVKSYRFDSGSNGGQGFFSLSLMANISKNNIIKLPFQTVAVKDYLAVNKS